MKQHEEFVMPRNENKVCKLKKSLYGLKQAPKQWHQKFDDVLLSNVFALNQADKCVYSKFDTSDPNLKLLPNNGAPVSQLEYSRSIGCLIYAMISIRPDIAYAIGRLCRYTRGAISWASNTPTCITNSTMGSEFVALAAAGKKGDWLRDLINEISLWPKPVSTISIRCDSCATLAKAYTQVYNGFVRTQLNLADHLTKGLARDLVHNYGTSQITNVILSEHGHAFPPILIARGPGNISPIKEV
ncbi:hypothetical protein OSB04_016856 [Centaurea solstitialis]|uniref:Reverse transcriptase Ty1/copia-type domain-containing protein n=1 Tax=Centaurea solstitialis TaxID=347529 RepID=A0AA38TF02_9ASTR|nr:hypothetical protein OSB04_016856 [Centaurea solstitialis]